MTAIVDRLVRAVFWMARTNEAVYEWQRRTCRTLRGKR